MSTEAPAALALFLLPLGILSYALGVLHMVEKPLDKGVGPRELNASVGQYQMALWKEEV